MEDDEGSSATSESSEEQISQSSVNFRLVLLEHLSRSEVNDINVFEMTASSAGRLQAFLILNIPSLYASIVPEESLNDRPYNLRCKKFDQTGFLLVRWKEDGEGSDVDVIFEICSLMDNVNEFNRSYQLSGVRKVLVIS